MEKGGTWWKISGGEKETWFCHVPRGDKESVWREGREGNGMGGGGGGESGSGDSSSLPIKKNKHGEYVGVRKLWGTRKKVSVEDVKERLGEKFDEAEKVEVVRVCKEESGRTRWWFWLKGEEDVLGKLDGVVMDGVWKVEERSPFLGVASVRVLSR